MSMKNSNDTIGNLRRCGLFIYKSAVLCV